MLRIKEWWDALTEDERRSVKAYSGRNAGYSIADTYVYDCSVCGQGPINATVCFTCEVEHKHIINKANEAIQDIAWEFHRQRLWYDDFGASHYVEVRVPSYSFSTQRFRDGEYVEDPSIREP